jgi:ABC-2 type transport system ATP-binding protein
VLTALHLTRTFGARVAVRDLSFTLERGEIFALLGPNGAGKTTTLRMLAGLIAPSAGTIHVNGEPMSRNTAPRLRTHIGFLTEAPGLWDRLTVRQTLSVYARLYGLPLKAVDEVLELFNIRDRAGDPTAQLSKGLKQRVAIARTLLHRPDIVLLDEPTAGLDPESARDVRELVIRLREQGRAVLMSTHNLDEVERVADRVAVVRSAMVAVGTPAALRSRLFGTRLRVALVQPAAGFADTARGTGTLDVQAHGSLLSIGVDDAAARAPQIVRRLVAAGADIQSVTPDEPTLEQVYLRLVGETPP